MQKNPETGKHESAIEFKVVDADTGEKVSLVVSKNQLKIDKKPTQQGPAKINDKNGRPQETEIVAPIQRGAPIEVDINEKKVEGTILTTPYDYVRTNKDTQ